MVCSDLSLAPIVIVHLNGLRFKRAAFRIEVAQPTLWSSKLHTYHVHLFLGVVTQVLMHYFPACHTDLVWKFFGSWPRTIRKA